MKKEKRYRAKKRPLTKEAMGELQEKLKTDPRLAREFAKDFKKGLASQGYFMTEGFRKELIREIRKNIKTGMKKLPASGEEILKKIEKGKEIKVKVKINRKKKTKNIKIR